MKLVISDNPAQGIMLGFNDICIPLCGDKAIIFRIADPDAPILSKDMPVENEITLSERSVFAYNAVQLSYNGQLVTDIPSGVKLLVGTNEYKTLNEGYTEHLNQQYFYPDYFDDSYLHEQSIAYEIEKIVGKQKMEQFGKIYQIIPFFRRP